VEIGRSVPPSSTPVVVPLPPPTFEDLFATEYAPMVRLAYLIIGSAAAAEDVANDAFLRVLERWSRLASPGGYLRTIVVRSALRTKRRTVRERSNAEHLGRRTIDTDPSIDEMWDALARLPVKQRAALVLRYYQDCSHEQIACALHCTVATARSLTHRGLAALRKESDRWITR
jgi:RNA polymerase sigma factor (sigma-70 family)